MFIKTLKLIHFEGVYVAMGGVTELFIDFSLSKNKICIITGPNGKGKTVLLSQLNPFATLGNVDVRDDINLILEGKDGYKQIVIVDGDDIYDIEHFYSPSKKSHTVKSYIKKNGEELNPNGNVGSFKERVKEELDMEPEYMKLVRLGNNVSNLIYLKGAERKAFMSKLLDDANVYLKYHKKVSADVTCVKGLVSHLADKLRKTEVEDVPESELALSSKREKITLLKETLSSVDSRLSVLRFKVSEIPVEIYEERKTLSAKIGKLKKYQDVPSLDDLRALEQKLTIDIAEKSVKIESLGSHITEIVDKIDSSMKDIEDSKAEISRIEGAIDSHDLEGVIASLEEDVEHKQALYTGEDNPTYHKQDIEALITFLREKQEILNTVYEFGKGPVAKVVELIKSQENVNEYVRRKLLEIERREDSTSAYRFLSKLMLSHSGEVPPGCPGSCFLLEILDDMRATLSKKSDKEDRSKEFYTFMGLAYTSIKAVLLSFGSSQELFDKLPKYLKDMFLTDVILDHIAKTEWIFDQKILFNELSIITDYDNYLDAVLELETKRAEMKKLYENSSLLYLKKSVENLSCSIASLLGDKNEAVSEKHALETSVASLAASLEEIRSVMEVASSRDELIARDSEVNSLISEREEHLETIRSLERQRSEIVFDLEKTESDATNIEAGIQQFKELTKELKSYQKVYDNACLIRDALSSREGIPLIFIDMYLKKAKQTVNDLLFQIYRGKMEISDFNIHDAEFTMPFIKNGKKIKDIVYASQGEQSFFSIALSLAISFESMSRYNIMLLDELDSVLDESNREHYISILERLVEMVDAEQLFVISHNDMFSMYPVDYISVIDEEPNSRYTNYIKIGKTM